MKFLKKISLSDLLPSLVLMLVGLVFILIPGIVFSALGYIVGGALLLFGGMQVVTSLAAHGALGFSGVTGVVLAVFGVIVLCFQKTILELIFIVIGILILLDGLAKLLSALAAKAVGQRDWLFLLVWAILVMGFGILILANPFQSSNAVVIFLGISVLVDGLQNFYSVFRRAWVSEKMPEKKFIFKRIRSGSAEVSDAPIEVEGEVKED